MKKIVISVLGQDRPGIISRVADALLQLDCNIENVSQTILQSEFSGIFIVSTPKAISIDALNKGLAKAGEDLKLYIHIKELKESEQAEKSEEKQTNQSFIITTRGPDRKGLVSAITQIMAQHNVNVTNLKAVFKGGDNPDRNIMIYEVDIPQNTDQKHLDFQLRQKAEELGLMLSIQHRNIFEAINRI